MHGRKALVLALILAAAAQAGQVSGASALELTRQVVEFGPRTPGSAASRKLQSFIVQKLKESGWQAIEDPFTAQTPAGRVAMKNIIGLKKGSGSAALAVSGHYDTKRFPFRFVGANDAGSSTGLLLELARAMKDESFSHDIYLVFFDGEEAFGEWSDQDSLYGSRHLAAKWRADGTLARLKALINVDMIGDRDLKIVHEAYSSEPLRRLVWQIAAELGHGAHFLSQPFAIEDDHVPFLRNGVRALNLIDFEYGPDHSWWHTKEDTMDKLSPKSLEIVGRVVHEALRRLSR
ncbi:MAG: M28 family peptidase [Bryobacteraceae bacterium]|nr:M28 family peptidase [Bryobacteraceae bacterium]